MVHYSDDLKNKIRRRHFVICGSGIKNEENTAKEQNDPTNLVTSSVMADRVTLGIQAQEMCLRKGLINSDHLDTAQGGICQHNRRMFRVFLCHT